MNVELNKKEIPEILQSIALGFPGGGFRAAAFSLGILSFLHETGLGENIKAISSVSGGSLTAARYVESMAKNQTFDNFYTNYYDWLLSNSLLPNAIQRFEKRDKKDFGNKAKNLINAFALEYRNSLVNMNFKELRKGLEQHAPHFDSLIINSTDFGHGLAFRFRSKVDRRRFGNGNYHISEFISSKIFLADAVAASSCFPGGFEPMKFPDDFISKNDIQSLNLDQIGLMDGGIIDNLGVQSYLTSSTDEYSCYLIGDAGGKKIESFKFSSDSKFTRWITLLLSKKVFLILAVFWVVISMFWGQTFIFYVGFLLLFLLALIHMIYSMMIDQINHIFGKKWLTKIPRNKIGVFALDRIKSLQLMASSIFVKVGKDTNLSLLYQRYGKDRVSKLSIYKTMLENGSFQRLYNYEVIKELGIEPSVHLSKISKEATQFDTTLWFPFDDESKKKDILEKLIINGKAVCCLSLIELLVKSGIQSESFIGLLKNYWNSMDTLHFEP